ncbi:Holliday junction branch migration protein RuvA [Microbacterium chocolatum]|uniref:Holliday junction branch migration protein RuvA n=1 Tax=Microbacterium aurantiacum TaxID=162393 RepID=UPI00338D476B
MISSLRGRVAHADDDGIVVEVGGVGLSVAVTPAVARTAHVDAELTLHTTLIVREDALSLYGFESRDELRVFSQLLGVTGVGPKSALGVLSSLTVGQIADAVAAEDDAPFRRVSGIGPKTAKLIVVQLTGKLDHVTASSVPGLGSTVAPGVAAQVVTALVGLGWPERTAAPVVESVLAEAPDSERASVPALLRRALAQLGPARKEVVGG